MPMEKRQAKTKKNWNNLLKTKNLICWLKNSVSRSFIAVSETRRLQTSRKKVDEFRGHLGAWKVGVKEGTAPAEMGWGTHEQKLPDLAFVPPYGPKNQIALAQMGINTWVRSLDTKTKKSWAWSSATAKPSDFPTAWPFGIKKSCLSSDGAIMLICLAMRRYLPYASFAAGNYEMQSKVRILRMR